MKTCSACGFLDLPSAPSCLRCGQEFPYEPKPPAVEHSESFFMLEDLAHGVMDGELNEAQQASLFGQIQAFLQRQGDLYEQQDLADLGAVRSGLREMGRLVQEARGAEGWVREDWDGWLEDAVKADLDIQRGAVPAPPVAMKGMIKWQDPPAEGGFESPVV